MFLYKVIFACKFYVQGIRVSYYIPNILIENFYYKLAICKCLQGCEFLYYFGSFFTYTNLKSYEPIVPILGESDMKKNGLKFKDGSA